MNLSKTNYKFPKPFHHSLSNCQVFTSPTSDFHFFSSTLFLPLLFVILFSLLLTLTGCSKQKTPSKTSELDFTIVSGSEIPKQLQSLLDEQQKQAFELCYSDQEYLYIAKGYGKQDTSGYSITVNDLYLSENEIVFDTELFGPEKDDSFSASPSYPYIVIKTEYREKTVVFN